MAADSSTIAPKPKRWPPERLRPVPARLRWPVRLLWLALFALAIVAQAGGLWRGLVQAGVTDQRFAAVGLVTMVNDSGDGLDIHPATPAAAKAGVPADTVILAIDGAAVPAGIPEEALAARLAGPDGPVRIVFRTPDRKARAVTLERSDAVRREALSGQIDPVVYFLFLASFGLIGAAALVTAAVLLVRRRPRDPVALLLSLSFLCAAASLERPLVFYSWLGMDWITSVIPSTWLGLLVAALPAFPDGRFVPRWGGWFAVIALPFVAIISLDDQLGDITSLVAFPVALLAGATLLIRYRRTPPGLERQQLKWAAFGFLGCVLLLAAAFLIYEAFEGQLLPDALAAWGPLAMLCLLNVSFILLPVGILVSLLRFRLWDADAAIGRSLSYAAITLLLGCVWAATAKAVEEMLTVQLGQSNQPLVAAIGAVVAALVFGPANGRINDWIDRRFRPGLVQLRGLPDRMRVWQHSDRPEDIAERVIDTVARGLRAGRAAMLLHRAEGYAVLAVDGVAPGEVAQWLAAHDGSGALAVDNLSRGDALFPLRMVLDDGGAPIGALLLGPRTDGNIYSADERRTLSEIEVPLAAALRQAQRRLAREARLGEALAGFDRRIERIEAALPALSRV